MIESSPDVQFVLNYNVHMRADAVDARVGATQNLKVVRRSRSNPSFVVYGNKHLVVIRSSQYFSNIVDDNQEPCSNFAP